jgi:sulfite reductase alpha subunit-like flavoprotein
MKLLWKKLLSKSHPQLINMRFTIFGLGDRSYGDNFCLSARKLRQRLISLGAL